MFHPLLLFILSRHYIAALLLAAIANVLRRHQCYCRCQCGAGNIAAARPVSQFCVAQQYHKPACPLSPPVVGDGWMQGPSCKLAPLLDLVRLAVAAVAED